MNTENIDFTKLIKREFVFEPRRKEKNPMVAVHDVKYSFFNDNKFRESRRFNHWVEKILKSCYLYILDIGKNSPIPIDVPAGVKYLSHWILDCAHKELGVINYYREHNEERKINTMFEGNEFEFIFGKTPFIPATYYQRKIDFKSLKEIKNSTDEIAEYYCNEIVSKDLKRYPGDEIFRNACLKFLHALCLYDSTINKDNFVGYNPTTSECSYILSIAFNDALCYSVDEFFYATHINVEQVKKFKNKQRELEEAQRKLIDLSKLIIQLEQDIDEKEKQIAELKPAETFYKKQIESRDKQIRHLQAEITRLSCSEEPIDSVCENSQITPQESEVEKKHVNRNLRYAFVSYENRQDWKQRILEYFPNSYFATRQEQVNATTTDAIVIMANFVSHNQSEVYKNLGLSAGIPVIMCNNFNPARIEDAIAVHFQNIEFIEGFTAA